MNSPLRAFCGTIALTAATVLPFGASAQTIPVPAPAPVTETQPNPSVPPTSPTLPNRSTDTPGFSQDQTNPAPRPLTQEPTISCPAGQFASKFPDVTPNDWAYEAVNRVASGPLRCFPQQG